MTDDWVRERLYDWAHWSHMATGLGYPSRTVEHRLMTEGAGASRRGRGGVPLVDETPQEVIETEEAVIKLPNDLRDAIMRKYLDKGTDKQKAKDAGVSYERFRRLVESGHSRLAGFLEAMRMAG